MVEEHELKVHIGDLHFEHALWNNQLKYYETELGLMNGKLEEVVRRNESKEVMWKLERFQNQWIRQEEVIHELKHKVRAHGRNMDNKAMADPIGSNDRYLEDHHYLKNRVDQVTRIYSELKTDFLAFLAQSYEAN